MSKDYYEILEVSSNASQAEIKQKYRELVKKYHPDRHYDNPLKELTLEKFKEVKEAYDVLGDPEERSRYDRNRKGSSAQQQSTSRGLNQFEVLLQEIDNLLNNRQWTEAKQKCKQAINLNSNSPIPYAFRGLAYLNSSQAKASLSDFEQAEKLGYNAGWFFGNYGVALNETGHFRKAITKLKKAVEIDGQIPGYIAHLAIAYESAGNLTKADQNWNKLERIDPNNPILQKRKQVWNNSHTQHNEESCCDDLCCFCLVLKCCFDCC
ncbi:DnaJ domain-containing protein [Natroniella sp. ANB-PHB2]|uniref:J domain-containing protein n=1 Tax=Natroniella sp. ANB-PHB2 TaxID=3384444 RepID=UPI0038D49176